MSSKRWNILDTYILKKFLTSFILSIALLMTIVVVFDLSENLNRFIANDAPITAIIVGRYFNFIPIFANLFANLFTFVSVIWFTAKLSGRNEIISIYNGGVSFKRLLVPYLAGALILSASSFALANFYIPKANEDLTNFNLTYMYQQKEISNYDLHVKTSDNTYVYIGRWKVQDNSGEDFTYEILGEKSNKFKIRAAQATYDEAKQQWHLQHYVLRRIDDKDIEHIRYGESMDTVFDFQHTEFNKTAKTAETMTFRELRTFIKEEKEKGSSLVIFYEIEKHKRLAIPFGIIIMTLLGFSVGSRKTRRGVGVHIFIGLALSFIYIFFQQVSNTFAFSGSLSPALASWLPNLIYLIVCAFMLKFAQK